ncbi:MAG: hypothetical protein V1791_04095, partial [Pseudomonadota bacterium]
VVMCQRCNYRRMLDGMGLDSTLSENHPPHPHFQCRSCGALQCMQPASLNMDIREVQRSFSGEITGLDIRVSGICGNCLKTERSRVPL